MCKTLRNAGLHTTQADSELLVLKALASPCAGGRETALSLSALGFVAYPGYSFKAPQGAALAAAKLVRSMQAGGLSAGILEDKRAQVAATFFVWLASKR